MSGNVLSHVFILALLAFVAVAACENGVVDPPDDADPVPQLASIDVSSSLDTLLAIGTGSQLTAVARDENGAVLANAPALTWSSSDRDVIRVGAQTGLVTAFGPGSATVTGTADGVSGTIRLTVVDADMEGLATAAADAFAARLVEALTAAAAGGAWTLAADGIETGNLTQLVDALGTLDGLASAASGHDRALFAVLTLYTDHMQTLLNL